MKQTIFNIRVGAFDYSIIHSEASVIHGDCSFSKLRLTVNFDAPDQKVLHTLLHEVTHAIDDAYCLMGDDEPDLEQRADTYATAWMQIFRDNPKYIKFIQKYSK